MKTKPITRETAQGKRPQTRLAHEERPAAYTPPPSVHAFLQNVWGKRSLLRRSEQGYIRSYLDYLQKRPLTPAQLEVALKIGKSVGIGYDAPDPDEKPTAQPWGPLLPLKPPGKR